MQILPPLLHYLEETCLWLMDDDTVDSSAQTSNAMQAVSNWQWLTVVVFCCPQHCLAVPVHAHQEQQSILQSEIVFVANEQ